MQTNNGRNLRTNFYSARQADNYELSSNKEISTHKGPRRL